MLLTLELHRWLRRHGIVVRVHLDGRDVTDRCVSADNGYGYVVLARLDDRGRRYHTPCRTRLAVELWTGAVRFVTPRGDLPPQWNSRHLWTFPRCSLS